MAGCSAMLVVDVFTNKFYSLAEKQLLSLGGDDTEHLGGGRDDYIEIVGSSHGWIALFNYDILELYLWNPVIRRRINLPPVNNLPTLKNLMEGGYCRVVIKKLILTTSNPDDADCRVVVLYGPSRLAFCCPGQSSGADWIGIGTWWWLYTDESRSHKPYADMAYSSQQNRLFCITESPHYELELWDLEDPWSPRIDDADSLQEVIYQYGVCKDGELKSIYLVIAEDEVLVVLRRLYTGRKWLDNIDDPHKTTGFIIFKVVQGEHSITVHPLHSLDAGLAMFVGLNHSFPLSASQFPELRPNSIYFTDTDSVDPEKRKWCRSVCCLSQYDIGIFDCKSRKFYPCYCSKEHPNEEEDIDGWQEESSEEEDYIYDEEHINGEESSEEEDNDGSRPYDEDLPKLVWFVPSSVPNFN